MMTKAQAKQKKRKAEPSPAGPTAEPITQYRTFSEAYDIFNTQLFGGELLPCPMITQQRQARSLGHFGANRWNNRSDRTLIHEINLNPDGFTGKPDREILGTLLHEMCHAWRQQQPDPPKRGYHDKLWARKMQEVGLMPSATGMADGKPTGQKVNHYILDDGLFAQLYASLEQKDFRLRWQSTPHNVNGDGKKDPSKTKFTCPQCGQNAWAKGTAFLICGNCGVEMLSVVKPEVEVPAGDASLY
jgi:hypothetical protein